MVHEYLVVEHSPALKGTVKLEGAKNAVLVIMASLILTSGKSRLTNVPASRDVHGMIALLTELGAQLFFDEATNTLDVDTTGLNAWQVSPDIMKKMRASVLVMGPLLARHGKAHIALPGGCALGARPIDLHLKAFARMGALIETMGEYLVAHTHELKPVRYVLDYPSVGATENMLMAAVGVVGVTEIVNAALEPEVLDLIDVLRKMGARIECHAPATIRIEGCGVANLQPVNHHVMYDRLEAGTLLLAAAITGGEIHVPEAPADAMELFLEKLKDMGHQVTIGANGHGVSLKATHEPKAVSFKTMPYPGFPTDLQAPTMAALCLAQGTSVIHETVFENRMLHVRELQKMGALIELTGDTATIKKADHLYGAPVIATDIRAAAGLVLAGLVAQGTTTISGVHHVQRGYHDLDKKLAALGAKIRYVTQGDDFVVAQGNIEKRTGI
jgi:UDP-N-acetylglucosamine 1-carboxyvinyltransferase